MGWCFTWSKLLVIVKAINFSPLANVYISFVNQQKLNWRLPFSIPLALRNLMATWCHSSGIWLSLTSQAQGSCCWPGEINCCSWFDLVDATKNIPNHEWPFKHSIPVQQISVWWRSFSKHCDFGVINLTEACVRAHRISHWSERRCVCHTQTLHSND